MAADIYPEFGSRDFLNKYSTLDYFLDKGAFGTVYGPIGWQGFLLALKEITFAKGKVTDEFRSNIKKKKDVWTSFEQEHLMRIYAVDLSRLPKAIFIVMEFAAGGSLYKALRSFESGNMLPIRVITDWALQIAEGMLYLHEKDIVHRDLKSSNILLMEQFDAHRPGRRMTLKIADFDDIKVHDHTTTLSFVGTLAYMAPEVRTTERFSKFSDVWSFGVVIWEMLSGDSPYSGLDSTAFLIKSAKGELEKLPIGQSFPEDYKLILNRCWKSTCNKRLSFEEIFNVLRRIAEEKDVASILKFKGNMMGKYFPDDSRDKFKLDPVLIQTIRTKAGEKARMWIRGLTILDNELFVVSDNRSEVEVYDSIILSFSRLWKLKELISPKDIGSCIRNKCIYISDCKVSCKSNEILRVDPNGKLITNWSTGEDWGDSLSVTNESNVILAVLKRNKLNEYLPDGQQIREINLSGARIIDPLHAIKLDNGNFVLCHGHLYLHRVCIVDTDGKLLNSCSGKPGSSIGQMDLPVHLFVDKNGFVLVADQTNHRVVILGRNLEYKREILSERKHGLRFPRRIILDESTNRALVVTTDEDVPGLIRNFQF